MKQLTFIKAIAIGGLLMSMTVASTLVSWTTDASHSRLGFTVKHLGITDVNGSFGTYDVKLTGSKEDLSDAKIELSGDAASINTANEMRDNHLKSADFLDAEKYPKFTFTSTSITKAGKGTFTVVGDLNLHGVTKSVTLTAKFNGKTTNPMSKKEVAGYKLTGTFKRSDFGIGASLPSNMVSDEVQLASDLELVKE
jgi:polyisoprenoid-binding protein YceI